MDEAAQKRHSKSATGKSPKRVTMTDVARLVGCSQATVSLVLNGVTDVRLSSALRNRVVAAAMELGYALPTSRTERLAKSGGSIAFVVDQQAGSTESLAAMEGARQASWQAGHVMLAAQIMSDPQIELRTLRALAGRAAVGLIYMAGFSRNLEVPKFLCSTDLPVVLLNCTSEEARFPAALPAETEGGENATSHLISNGHRKIATITGEPRAEVSKQRFGGYRRALSAAGIDFDPALVEQADWTPRGGYLATQRLLALAELPTAIFCQNDRMAVGCYEALREAGLSVPNDVSVVGYDDDEAASHLLPELTTVSLPHLAMGQWAVEQLMLERDCTAPAPLAELPCTLVERGSVAQPAR